MGYFSFATRWFAGKAALAKSKTMDTAESARVNAEAAGESVANTATDAAISTEQTTQAAAQNTADTTASAANAPVDKVKGHRPKVSHHESVEKFKQAFHIKDKHDKKAAVASET